MKRLLIAEPSEIFTLAFMKELHAHFEISICSRGDTALALLESVRPDALVINLTLPGIDGLTVLQRSAYTPPVILAFTDFQSGYITRAAEAAGVDCILLRPCSFKAAAAKLKELISKAST